jgi:hypothetical protein
MGWVLCAMDNAISYFPKTRLCGHYESGTTRQSKRDAWRLPRAIDLVIEGTGPSQLGDRDHRHIIAGPLPIVLVSRFDAVT